MVGSTVKRIKEHKKLLKEYKDSILSDLNFTFEDISYEKLLEWKKGNNSSNFFLLMMIL